MDLKELLDTKLGTDVRRSVALDLSDNEDAKKAKDTDRINVDIVFGADWTVEDLIDRLMVSNSPKVTYQNKYRKVDLRPLEWKCNKAGAKSVDVTQMVRALSPEAKKALIEQLKAELGDTSIE